MKTVRIQTQDLIRQLPKSLQYAFIIDQISLPKSFILQVSEGVEEFDVLKEKYPQVREVLTWTQWVIFRDMISATGAGIHLLARHLNTSVSNQVQISNSVAVHAYAIRCKFKRHNLPFSMIKMPDSFGHRTLYKVIEIPHT